MQKLLEEIGLTKGEVAVYFALLEIGSSTVGKIVDLAKVSSSKVYDILQRLIDKGLASYVIKENTKYFEAASPQRILDYLKEKESRIRDQAKEVERVMPELLLKQKMAEKKQEVNIYEGIKGIKTANEKTLQMEEGSECYFMGTSVLSASRLKDYWPGFNMRREKKKIRSKILFNRDVAKEVLDNRNSFKLCRAKYMPYDISTPSWIEIFDDSTIIGVPSENPIALEIKNRDVAESFKAYFEALWGQKVNVFEGTENVTKFFTNILTELKGGEEYHVLNANYGNAPGVGKFFPGYHKKRQKKGIKVNFLLNNNMRGVFDRLAIEPASSKFLPRDFESPLQITFYGEKLYLSLWSKKPIGILVQSRQIVRAFKSYYDTLWNQDTRIERGIDAVEALWDEMLEAGSGDLIGARGYFVERRPKFIDDWEKRAVKQGFRMRNIVDPETKGHRITKLPFAETKYLIPKEFSKLSVFWIFGNKVVISNWTEEEPIVVVIENESLYHMYKQQFELMWGKGIRFE
ncbi:MAG: helix-turn-helix domain-containing protein [archaeon]